MSQPTLVHAAAATHPTPATTSIRAGAMPPAALVRPVDVFADRAGSRWYVLASRRIAETPQAA